MIQLPKAAYAGALDLYRSHEAFFPLIADVLLDDQDGRVYADDANSPRQIYVEHAFGFSQVFGRPNPKFESALKHYWLSAKSFRPDKIRLYTPYLPEFLLLPECDGLRSERRRFVLPVTSAIFTDEGQRSIETTGVDATNVSRIESAFGIVNRFWKTAEDFIARSLAVVAWAEGKPAAICYAAAVADDRAEIDVMTLPEFRNLGLGKQVVAEFARACLTRRVKPVWDCFTNNAGSLALCRSIGFTPLSDAYPFFTINKQPGTTPPR